MKGKSRVDVSYCNFPFTPRCLMKEVQRSSGVPKPTCPGQWGITFRQHAQGVVGGVLPATHHLPRSRVFTGHTGLHR
jgi:hypothetical protein